VSINCHSTRHGKKRLHSKGLQRIRKQRAGTGALMRCCPFVIAALLAGCEATTPGPVKYAIKGQVQLDGQPVSEGAIQFRPVDPDGTPEGATIRTGHFSAQARPGEYLVEITAGRETGQIGPLGERMTEQYIPEKYNKTTELTVQVEDRNQQNVSFDLKSKK